MIGTISRIISIKPSDITLSRVVRAIIRRVKDWPHLALWYFPFGLSNRNKNRLKKYKNIHRGKRCFILANGPSLLKINFSFLKDEITIGMNRVYLLEKEIGFTPNYTACIDHVTQLKQFRNEYNNLNNICFYDWNMRGLFSEKENIVFIKNKFSPRFSVDPTKYRVGNGKSVTYTCFQLAFYMGFQEVYLIGKDHNYNTSLSAGVCIVSTGNEKNHFIKGYYKKGQVWDAPDYISEEFAYKITRKEFEKNGRIIKDATIGGKLEIFEKIDIKDLFQDKLK